MNRLGIFLTYDADGIIDNYIEEMLKDICKELSRLVIVCNGVLSSSGRRKLEKYSDEIMVRENIGFDFCAWKDAMFEYIGFSRIQEFDQLILFNDSFFGPVRSFKEVFDEMDGRDVDFWGLTVHGEVETVRNMCPYGYRPRYLQTYFMAFNKRLINDYSFLNYWKNIPVYSEFLEVGEKCSAVITKYFEDLGFSWGVYSDTTELETDRETNICHHAFNTYEIVANRRYPIIKRKSFVLGKARFLRHHTGSDLEDAVNYIGEHTDYDLHLIYEHIARRYDLSEIKESLNLNYIFSDHREKETDAALSGRTLMVAHLYHEDLIAESIRYLKRLPKETDLFLTTDTEEKKALILRELEEAAQAVTVAVVPNHGRYISALLITAKDYISQRSYDYIGILHDSHPVINDPITVGASFRRAMWDNIVPSSGYVENVLSFLENNRHIGMLVPPVPFHGKYYSIALANKMEAYAPAVDKWNQLLQLDCKLPEKAALALGGVCWCRKEALESVWKNGLQYEDFQEEEGNFDIMRDAFERMLPYIVQKNGFLTGWCMNERYAASEIENLRYISSAVYNHAMAEHPVEDVNFQNFLKEQRSYVKKLKKQNKSLKKEIESVNQPQKDTERLKKEIQSLKKETQSLKKQIRNLKQENERLKTENVVEVPVLVEIGLKRALQNYIRKIFKRKQK